MSVLDRVLKLRPSTYRYRNRDATLPTGGLIAQEVEKLFPETVTEKDGIKAIYYSAFGVIAIKAIQEQQEQINELRAEVDRLRDVIENIDAVKS